MSTVPARRLGPPTRFPGAVLAVADKERLLVAREHDVDNLPVALVRLPDRSEREERVAIDVVVVEEPVLKHDPPSVPRDTAVHDAGRLVGSRGDVTGEVADGCTCEAVALVQPPNASRARTTRLWSGEAPRRGGRSSPAGTSQVASPARRPRQRPRVTSRRAPRPRS